ncbi:MAG: glucose-6-phosphate dehydrogenase [Candidatus Cloacimonetes bacterium]|jgi:glucose-6-phosphate 1-dehydrogenase|nr:glucose-6-phosphate dehydrogenase [Candidatus Cloacimonadota bacterium]
MIVIFGATGDLTRRKLIPALQNLFLKGKLKDRVVCLARKKYSRLEFLETLQTDRLIGEVSYSEEFLKLISYHFTDFSSPNIDYLKSVLTTDEEVTFYLAVGPELFQPITDIIRQLNLGRKKIVFEKPFGNDLESATRLNRCISKTFKEKEIYRIDHYLGKEMVQNILVFRFANSIFEHIWNSNFIKKVEIIISEEIGVEQRSDYYDKAGALRDMMQNHLLQLLALTAMSSPVSMKADDIRDEVADILRKVKTREITVAQYNSYRKEVNKLDSETETYVSLTLDIEDDKWREVPFVLTTGKKLAKRFAEINLIMKDVSCKLFSSDNKDQNIPNMISLKIQPNEGIIIKFNAKIPGTDMELQQVKMEFCHKCEFGPNTPEAYESLLQDIIEGDQTLFTRWDSVEASWRIIDPIIEKKNELSFYKEGSEVNL